MSKRKFRKFVFPAIYVILITTILFSTYQIWNMLKVTPVNDDLDYVTGTFKNDVVPAVKEEDTAIGLPYTSDKVSLSKKFYDSSATPEEQQNSLIFYENIYMPNTGVLYTSDEEFDVISMLSGTVKNIKEDEIMGSIAEVEYNQNLTVVYQGLKDVKVTINQELNKGDVIAKSGNIKFETEKPNALHIEVYKDGLLLNPLDFYNMKTTDFS